MEDGVGSGNDRDELLIEILLSIIKAGGRRGGIFGGGYSILLDISAVEVTLA